MKVKILNTYVDKTTKKAVLSRIEDYLKSAHKFFIVTPNPEICVAGYYDHDFAEILNSADIAIPDGVGLKLADLGLKTIKGRELMTDLFMLANDHSFKVYLLGGVAKVNKDLLAYVSKNYPKAIFKGESGPILDKYSEPVSDRELGVEKQVIDQINKFKPDLLFVAFGAPKQEKWVARHIKGLKIGGAMVVGGSFDYLVASTRTPKIMEVLGLEWLFRLVKEPARLGRIFTAVIVFPLFLLRKKLIVAS